MLKSQGLIESDPDYVKGAVFPTSVTPRTTKSDLDDAVRDYLMSFYKSICDAEDDGFALETAERNVLQTIENCLYDKG